jgi:glycosyltransferase involved in cell wall biosynthesis
MVHGLQVLGWAWFASRFAGAEAPRIVLMLRFQSDWYADPIAQRGFRKLEKIAGNGRIRIVTDSARLVEDYASVTSLPIDVVPIPHMRTPVGPHTWPSRAKGGVQPLRFVSLGNARDEKGIVEIMQAIELLQSRTAAADFEFVLHTYSPYPDDMAAKIGAFTAKRFPNVVTVDRSLTAVEYTELLYKADVVLLPYWREIYRARTSGILIEAIAAGKAAIVTEDTWMSDQLARYGAGEVCPNRNPSALAEIIRKVGRSFPAYFEKAQRTRETCAAEHNPGRLLEALVPDPASASARAAAA